MKPSVTELLALGGFHRQAGGAGPATSAYLTCFQGIFAPDSSLGAQLTPSGRGKKSAADAESTRASSDERTPTSAAAR